EPKHKETLLHLVMKLGLIKLSQFLAAQPGGSSALALPNEDGATPLDLALQNGHSKLVEVFANFQGSHLLDISRAEISEGACVQFVHSSGALTLTFSHTAQHLLFFRKYFWDRSLLYQVGEWCSEKKKKKNKPYKSSISHQKRSSDLGERETCSAHWEAVWDSYSPLRESRSHCCVRAVGAPEQRHSTLDVLRKLKAPPTFFAATKLTAMLSGSDEVYANCMLVDQVSLCLNSIHFFSLQAEQLQLGDISSIPMAKSSSSPSLEENDQYIYIPNEGNQRPVKNGEDEDLRHTVSPSDPYGADSCLPFKTHGLTKDRGQHYADVRKRSSSLDDLEVDGGSGGVLDRSHIHYPHLSSSETMAGSSDGLDLPTDLQPKECTVFGIRSRSYSCSSPKGLLGRPRIPRDFSVGDSNDG
ncbi:Rho guanine nucleotide exchange factor 28, partial [Apaloderma vittatum]